MVLSAALQEASTTSRVYLIQRIQEQLYLVIPPNPNPGYRGKVLIVQRPDNPDDTVNGGIIRFFFQASS